MYGERVRNIKSYDQRLEDVMLLILLAGQISPDIVKGKKSNFEGYEEMNKIKLNLIARKISGCFLNILNIV